MSKCFNTRYLLASSAGHSGDREPVQSQRTTNILAWGSWNQYVLRLCDNTWQQWKGRTESLDVIGCEVMCYNKKVYIIGGIDIHIYSIQENKWSEGPNLPVHPSVLEVEQKSILLSMSAKKLNKFMLE